MLITNVIFIILVAFFIAKLEIQVEGKDGWAKNLPTWKVNNRLTKMLLREHPFTGYHLWAFLTMAILLHFPFFLGFAWNLSLEIKIISTFFLIAVLEDFLWFVLNPYFGLKKFNSKEVGWHRWIGPIPLPYIVLLAGAFLLLALNNYFL